MLYAQRLESACKPKHVLLSKAMKVALSGHREFRIKEASNLTNIEHQVYWLHGFYDTMIDKISGASHAQTQLTALIQRMGGLGEGYNKGTLV